MTIHYVAKAYKIKIGSAATKAVLIYLATRANKEGQAWPGIATISKETEFSRSAVKRSIAEVEALGLIRREPRYGKGKTRSSNLYAMIFDRGGVTVTPPPVHNEPTPVHSEPTSDAENQEK